MGCVPKKTGIDPWRQNGAIESLRLVLLAAGI